MSDKVQVTVKSQLLKIVEDLVKIGKAGKDVSVMMAKSTEEVGESVKAQTDRVQQGMSKLTQFSKNASSRMKEDFKTLFNVNALTNGLQLNNQFRNTIKETVSLSDAIRKMSTYYGIAKDRASDFQSAMSKGLAKFGLSSDVGGNSMAGLKGTGVKGEENLIGYAQSAGQLASMGGESGNEANVSKGMAEAIQQRGGNVNDMTQVSQLSTDVTSAMNQSGKSASEVLETMNKLYAGMSSENRKNIGGGAIAQMSGIESEVGPGALSFMEPMLKAATRGEQAHVEARMGTSNLIGKEGFDINAFQKWFQDSVKLGGGNAAEGLRARGVSEDQIQNVTRLFEKSEQLKGERFGPTAKPDVAAQYTSQMGLGEAFRANMNQTKGFLADLLSGTQGVTEGLANSSTNKGTAALVSAGGAAVAASQLGTGMQLLQKIPGFTKLMGAAGEAAPAAEAATSAYGAAATPAAYAAGGAETAAAGAGTAVLAPVVASAATGLVMAQIAEAIVSAKAPRGFEHLQNDIINAIEEGFNKVLGKSQTVNHKVEIDMKAKEFKATAERSRGTSF